MSELTLEKETTKLEKYFKNKGRQDFIDGVRAGSGEYLDKKLLGLAKYREVIKNTKAEDAELKTAAERKKVLEAPYREQLKDNEKLARFVALIMKEQDLE